MTEDQADKADRLLEIISSLYGRQELGATEELPFYINKEGEVVFGDLLQNELDKPQHQDLLVWAEKNITQLFE